MEESLWLLLLLVLSGFFSGAEIALFSLGPEKIKALKDKAKTKKKLQRIEKLEQLKSESDKLLVTILLGNNVVNVAASAMATVAAQKWASATGYSESTTLVLAMVTGVMTFLILLFGEIIPKSLCHRHALRFSLIVAPFIRGIQILLYPIIVPLSQFLGKFSDEEEVLQGLSEDELKAAVALAEEEGSIDHDEKEWVERILEFDEHTVASVMTPRSKIFALQDNLSLEAAVKKIKEVGYSRMPVYHQELDEVIGVLTIRTMLEALGEVEAGKTQIKTLELWDPLKIPTTMKIDTVLQTFQREKTHMALIYDEHGGLVGLITLEDVLEEVFGEIQDEEDEELVEIRRVGSRLIRCSADTELEQIEHFIVQHCPDKPTALPWDKSEENKTLGLYLLEQLEKFPELDEAIIVNTLEYEFGFIIKKLDSEHIEEVEMTWQETN